jgi:hypothetical protein
MQMTEQDFWDAYERLSQTGRCDGPGGMEYRRVLDEWKRVGCLSGIEHFIAVRASLGPDGNSWRAAMN